MTMTSSSIQIEDQLALRIEKEVRQQMDGILENIQKISTEYKIATKDEKSPFRNVLAVAVESSSSLEVIKNYIRYQVGRNGSSRIWSLRGGSEQKLFAQELVNALDNLSEDVDQIIGRVKTALGGSSNKDAKDLPDDLSDDEALSIDDTPQEKSSTNENNDDLSKKLLSQSNADSEPSSEQKKLLAYLADKGSHKVLKQSLHLELAQLYLGYLAREHTAQVGEKEATKGSNSALSQAKVSTQKNQSSKGNPKQPKKPIRR